jgi:hypothetical protein
MRSITAPPRPGEVTIINDVEYASIHNEGGEVNPRVTEKMKWFAWYKVYSIAKIRKRKPGEKRRKKGTAKPLPPEAEMWKALALKKTRLHIKIPQRRFIGDSKALQQKIDELIIKTIPQKSRKMEYLLYTLINEIKAKMPELSLVDVLLYPPF